MIKVQGPTQGRLVCRYRWEWPERGLEGEVRMPPDPRVYADARAITKAVLEDVTKKAAVLGGVERMVIAFVVDLNFSKRGQPAIGMVQ